MPDYPQGLAHAQFPLYPLPPSLSLIRSRVCDTPLAIEKETLMARMYYDSDAN